MLERDALTQVFFKNPFRAFYLDFPSLGSGILNFSKKSEVEIYKKGLKSKTYLPAFLCLWFLKPYIEYTYKGDEWGNVLKKGFKIKFLKKDENGEYTSDYGNRLIALLSELLLQIRKDLYTKKTKLKRSEMLEFMITDMEKTKRIINEMKF